LWSRIRRPEGFPDAALWNALWLGWPAGLVVLTWLAGMAHVDIFLTRYHSVVLPSLAVGAGSALAGIARWPRLALLTGLSGLAVLSLNAVYFDPSEQRDDWRTIARAI